MKLLDFLSPDSIITNLRANNKADAIRELAKVLTDKYDLLDLDILVTILLEREKIGSTGIGRSVAIPHGKYPGLETFHAVIGRSTEGVEFQALDGEKVYFFCLLVAPVDSVSEHLKALARISRIFKQADFIGQLKNAESAEEIWDILAYVDGSMEQ